MAGEERVGLEIDIENASAKRGVKVLEKDVEKATKGMSADVRKVQADLDKTGKKGKAAGRSMLDAGKAGSKGASIAGAGFASMSAGISAATATAENMEGAMIGAGASVAAAFGAGGPVGAALAVASIGIGLLIKGAGEFKQSAKDAARAFGDEFKAAARSAQVAQTSLRADIRKNIDLMNELRGIPATSRRGAGAEDSAVAQRRIVLDLEEKIAAQRERVSIEQSKINRQFDESARLFAVLNPESGLQDEIRSRELNLDILKQSVVQSERALESERERLGVLESRVSIAKRLDTKDRVDRVKAQITAERELNASIKDGAEHDDARFQVNVSITSELQTANDKMHDTLALMDVQDKKLEREERRRERINNILDAKRRKIDDVNQRIDRELALLNAGTRFERDRVRVEQDRVDLLNQGADLAKVEEITRKKLADIAKAEADALKDSLDTTKERAKVEKTISEKRKSSGSRRGNNSPFGASRRRVGTGLGNIFAPVDVRAPLIAGRARKRETTIDPFGAAGGSAKDIPDSSPEIKKTGDEQKKVAESLKRMKDESVKLAEKAIEAARVGGDAAEQLVSIFRQRTQELQSEIRRLERIVNQARRWGMGP